MARLFTRANQTSLWSGANNPNITALPYTIAGWFYPTAFALGEFYTLAGIAGSNASSYVLCGVYQDDARPGIWTVRNQVSIPGSGVGGWPLNPGVVTPNAWNHITYTATQTAWCSYINGGSKATQVVSTPQPAAGEWSEFGLGGYINSTSGNGHYINGRLAEWGIWNVALTDDEAAALGKGISPRLVRPSALVNHYQIFGVNSPEPDRWRNAKSLGVYGNVQPPKDDHPPLARAFGISPALLGSDVFVADLRAAAAFAFTGAAALTSAPQRVLASAANLAFSGSATLSPSQLLQSVDAAVRFTAAADLTEYQYLTYASQVNKTVGALISPE